MTLKPSVFVKAARIVSNSQGLCNSKFCCCTLENLNGHSEFEFFKDVFGPDRDPRSPWWNQTDYQYYFYDQSVARSIALLLCAEMAKDMRDV